VILVVFGGEGVGGRESHHKDSFSFHERGFLSTRRSGILSACILNLALLSNPVPYHRYRPGNAILALLFEIQVNPLNPLFYTCLFYVKPLFCRKGEPVLVS
jgi:hypothetical protein